MITKIHEFKKIYESANTSTDSKILYDKLVKLFNPTYNIERPSGHYLNNIDMRFNDKTTYADVKKIIQDANWYLSYINNGTIRDNNFIDSDIYQINIKPIYGTNTTDIPDVLYHITPTFNDENIQKYGIHGSIGGKSGLIHPKRVYLCKDTQTLMTFVKELNYTYGTKLWTIWEITTSKTKIPILYIDETVNQSFTKPKAVYVQDVDINPDSLKIYEHITL